MTWEERRTRVRGELELVVERNLISWRKSTVYSTGFDNAKCKAYRTRRRFIQFGNAAPLEAIRELNNPRH